MRAQATTEHLPDVRSVLAVCAHPDDESFGLGATLHAFSAAGARVSVLCFTHGEASSLGASVGASVELRQVRSAELEAAARVLGVHHTELLDHPDGALHEVPLDELAEAVRVSATRVGADLLLVFDQGGITGHPDHCRATEAALAGAPELPVLAWVVPAAVAASLHEELGVGFVGRSEAAIDLLVRVDRAVQRQAVACHASQSVGNPVVWRRLELHGEHEAFRWLRRRRSLPGDLSRGCHQVTKA
jgi:N-acetylglucosamine malate deacetylase 2